MFSCLSVPAFRVQVIGLNHEPNGMSNSSSMLVIIWQSLENLREVSRNKAGYYFQWSLVVMLPLLQDNYSLCFFYHPESQCDCLIEKRKKKWKTQKVVLVFRKHYILQRDHSIVNPSESMFRKKWNIFLLTKSKCIYTNIHIYISNKS